jgi:ring-1,2-phenylacetyl-CoA epoxidase subunit PaaC
LAYRRDAHLYGNHLLVELPNGHWGDTLARQFFFDAYNFFLLEQLSKSPVPELSALAQKAYKEVSYHAQFSAEWIIRLGDGTDESHAKIQQSVNRLWAYTGELFEDTDLDRKLDGAVPLPSTFRADWLQKMREVFALATLELPDPNAYMQKGGLHGRHTEHLGYILAEMQYLPRAYPDAKW